MGATIGEGVGEFNTINHVNNGEEVSEVILRRPSINLENRTDALKDAADAEELRLNDVQAKSDSTEERVSLVEPIVNNNKNILTVIEPLALSALQPFPVVEVTADFIPDTDTTYLLRPILNAMTVQLPPPVDKMLFNIKEMSGVIGVKTITIVRNGAELIDGVALDLIIIASYESVTLTSDGTDWFRLGTGTGGGGGVGDITSVQEELKATFRRLSYSWLTAYDSRVNEEDYTDTTNADFDFVDKVYSFPILGDDLVTTDLYGSRFKLGDRLSKEVRLEIFQGVEDQDTSFVAELSQDNGVTYEVVTMDRVGESAHHTGVVSFPQDAPASMFEYPVGNADGAFEFDASGAKKLAIPFTVTNKTAIQEYILHMNKVGSPLGTLTAKVVNDVAGEPSLLVADILLNGTLVNIETTAAGDTAPVLSLGVGALPAGNYWVMLETDATYQATFITGVASISLRTDSSTHTSSDTFQYDGTVWSAIAGVAGVFQLSGFQYGLKLRYTSNTVDSVLIGYGVFYAEAAAGFTKEKRNRQTIEFSGDENKYVFTIANFLPNLHSLHVDDPGVSQKYTHPNFRISGNQVIFKEGTFDAPGETLVLHFVQDFGNGFDNSDENAALMAANNLGSLDPTLSKSSPGRGIVLELDNANVEHLEIGLDALGFIQIISPV